MRRKVRAAPRRTESPAGDAFLSNSFFRYLARGLRTLGSVEVSGESRWGSQKGPLGEARGSEASYSSAEVGSWAS